MTTARKSFRYSGARPNRSDQLQELSLEDIPANRCVAAALLATVIVGVAGAVPAGRETRRQRRVAFRAANESAEWKLRVVSVIRGDSGLPSLQDRLNTQEQFFGDDRLERSARGGAPVLDLQATAVDGVAQNAVEGLERHGPAATRSKPELVDHFQRALRGVDAAGKQLERLPDERCPFGIMNQR